MAGASNPTALPTVLAFAPELVSTNAIRFSRFDNLRSLAKCATRPAMRAQRSRSGS